LNFGRRKEAERPHDNLDLAVAVAAWHGERHVAFRVVVPDAGVEDRSRWPSGWWA